MLIESIDDENLNIRTDLTVLDNLLCQRCKKNLKEYLKIKVKEAEIKNMELITGTLNICDKCNKTIRENYKSEE